ncbi:hypothetical protein [Photobacterium leiognathi]|uniref:hypothetical protein n=1 Tax=Photobacterium leiognathi TaxID=553611 RepID=UPI002980AFE2|nr:hypothetical protein [Photobacterium leiognathi]
MKKLIIPTLIMSAFAVSNAVADPMDIHFQGNVIKSASGVHWYSHGRDQIQFTDTNISSNPDESADYVIHPRFVDAPAYIGGTDWQSIAMMTTNTVSPYGNDMQSMPFQPVITVKIGDEQVNFDDTGASSNDVTYQDAAGVKVTWAAGGINMNEAGIAWDPLSSGNGVHQVVKSVLSNFGTPTWAQITGMLNFYTLEDKAFGSDKAKILASGANTYDSDWWNGSDVAKIGDASTGYDFVKFGTVYWSHLQGQHMAYSVQRWFTVNQPTVTIPSAAFADGKTTYQATISITSASV